MPLVADCLDGDETGEWISCVLGFLHPRLILLKVRPRRCKNECDTGNESLHVLYIYY